MSRAVVGDDAGGGAVREERTTPSTSSMQFPEGLERWSANERANSGKGGGGMWVVVLTMQSSTGSMGVELTIWSFSAPVGSKGARFFVSPWIRYAVCKRVS